MRPTCGAPLVSYRGAVPSLPPPSSSALLAPSPSRPRLAALFWFYKAFDDCRERVVLLRSLNPGLPIFGLYGGPLEDAGLAQSVVGSLLDDLYVYSLGDADWRWIHGDQVIAAWHAERGRALGWDSLVIVQWDMLLLAPLLDLTSDLRIDEAAFSGDRPLAEVTSWWGWGGAGDLHQNEELARFRAFLQTRYDYRGPLWCCLFIAAVLPRGFLDRYAAEGPPRVGFLEYKVPTLARVFGTPVRALPALAAWWRADPTTRDAAPADRTVNATGTPIDPNLIAAELARPDGRRVFHPVFETPAFLRGDARVFR